MKINVKINCHSSICLNDNIYIDPFKIKEKIKAKVIFITHPHWDHLDKDSIKKISDDKTVFVCPADCKEILLQEGIKKEQIKTIKPFEMLDINGIRCEALPSYNKSKPFHSKENNWLGYLLTIEGIKYFICGDTDLIEEIKDIKTDVLFVPIGGTYTMNPKEGAALANAIRPKLTIPTHYGDVVGDVSLYKEFLSFLDKSLEYLILIK